MARPPQDAPPDDIDVDEPEAALPEPDQAGLFDDATPERLKSGVEAIRAAWATLPNGPGVYRMLGQGGEVLYVGKARSLKKRVASYTRGVGHTNRIARMIASTSAMEFVTTATETEALLLETNYIKQLKPRFNVLMRDDKSFPYILLTGDHAAPQLCKHRGARNRKGEYFGPFASAQAVGRTINALQRAFLIRTCSDSYFENRTRPCLLHQIKRCAGPCTGEVSGEEYAALVREAKDFLSGRSVAVREQIAREMQAASEDLEFERAARYRDRLAALSAIQSTQDINPRETEEADVFAVHEEAGQFIIEAFFFRAFQNWGNRAFYPRADRTLTPAEVLDAFLGQFYDERPAARLVLLNHEIENRMLLAEALSTRAGRKVEIAVPRRGEKKDLVDHAATNAREALSRRLADAASQKKLIDAMAAAFGLPRPPRRIDVFDNSHIMGTNAVGAMIVAGEQGFLKTHYRTFNIRSEDLTPGDDYGMMREVLGRRFARLQKEAPRPLQAEEAGATLVPQAADEEAAERDAALPAWPDLVLIDGGKGQLDAAKGVLDELGVTGVPLVGVAKGPDRDAGRETFFIEGRTPFRLSPRDPVLYFVQRLRDEAHRFAIGAHRAKRRRELVKNPLDEIAGIGPRRKRALLLHFGTAKAVGRASFEDLMKCPGVNEATARAVYAFFHEGAA